MMVRIKSGDFVLPGQFLSTSEEFVPGNRAYEEGGNIYSASTGVVLVDARTKRISVFPKTSIPPAPKRDDVVIGRVEDVKDQAASVRVEILRGSENRQLPLPLAGTIHISQATDRYVRDLSRQFKTGDIVRAKILNTHRAMTNLSTVGENLGVILALCSRCRTLLKKKDATLWCPNCGNVEFRKISKDYRQGIL